MCIHPLFFFYSPLGKTRRKSCLCLQLCIIIVLKPITVHRKRRRFALMGAPDNSDRGYPGPASPSRRRHTLVPSSDSRLDSLSSSSLRSWTGHKSPSCFSYRMGKQGHQCRLTLFALILLPRPARAPDLYLYFLP